MNEIIVTLYEGHYHYGVAALANSLSNAGFNGVLRVGYRGQLPPWISQFDNIEEGMYRIGENLFISFVSVNPPMHFGYYKPLFMKETLATYPQTQNIYYFDPDIVVNAPWLFFSDWVQSGIALCLDNCFHFVHHNHPWRREWVKLAGVNMHFKSNLNYYVNSGFIGLEISNSVILDKWIALTENYKSIGGNLHLFEKDGHRPFKGDQDLLNAALMVLPELKISLIGKEGMGFSQPAYLMSHAVSNIKPWRKQFVKSLFQYGQAPNLMDKDYLKYANYPIKSYGRLRFMMKKADSRLASILGRILG
jgi:hypothetical protein